MDTRKRGETFGRYVGLELKGAITAYPTTAKAVAEQIGRADANLNRWLNGKTEIPITVLCEVCEVIDIEPRVVVEHAYDRMIEKLGEHDATTEQQTLRRSDFDRAADETPIPPYDLTDEGYDGA